MASKYLEELIYKFLSKSLTDKEKRDLTTGYDAEKYIDEETEDEMRQEIWNYVFRNVLWAAVLVRLRNEAEDETDDEEDEFNESEEED